LQLGRLLHRSGRHAEAVERLGELLERTPDHPEAAVALALGRLPVRATDDAGEPLEARLRCEGSGMGVGTEGRTLVGPSGAPFELELTAEGHVPLRVEGRLPAPTSAPAPVLACSLPRRASIVAPAGARSLRAAGREAVAREDALVLDALAPGPLVIHWIDAGGEPQHRAIELAPGERLVLGG